MERRAHADRCEDLPSALPDDMGEPFHLLEPLFYNGDSAVSLLDLMIEVTIICSLH